MGREHRVQCIRSRLHGVGEAFLHRDSPERCSRVVNTDDDSALAVSTPVGEVIQQQSGGIEEGPNDQKGFGEDEEATEARRQERRGR